MENTLDNNSNSGSDISDSWAVIDDESSLEWNNVIGLGLRPHQNDFTRRNSTLDLGLGLPSRPNSRNQLSDEESIEVVAEDSTDDLSDKDIEIVQEEEHTIANHLETKGKITTGTIIETKPSQQKSQHVRWTESIPILMTILALGILVGLCVGYLGALHSQESEASTSIYPTQALLKKLESDNKFLRWRLRSAHTYMKSTIAKTTPNLNHISKQDSFHFPLKNAISQTVSHSDDLTKQYLHNNMNLNSLNLSDSGTCSITEFVARAPMLQDYCLMSEKPQGSEYVSTTQSDRNASNVSDSSSINTSLVKDSIQTENTLVDYNEPLVRLQDSHANDTVHSRAEDVASDNSEAGTDPRPYTKLRTTVETIYTILSILDNEEQTGIPSKEEFLSILLDNVNVNDLSKQPFSTNSQEKITSFEMQIQDTTRKLLDDMDSFITSFVQNIALKIKEVEHFNKKLICDLKTNLIKSADLYVVDLNRITIFQKCIEEEPYPINQPHHYDHIVESETQHEIEGSVSERYVARESIISDQNESVDAVRVVEENEHIHPDCEKGNVQQLEKQTEEFDFGANKSPAKHQDFAKISKLGKSGRKRKSYKKEREYGESRGKTKYSDNGRAKISKQRQADKMIMSNTKEQKYDEAYGKTKYAENDGVTTNKHGNPRKKRFSETKKEKYNKAFGETKYSHDSDHIKINQHRKSSNEGMYDTKEQKYKKAFGKTKYFAANDDVKISKQGKSGKKQMSDNKEYKYDESHDKTTYSDGNDRIKISKHGKSSKKIKHDNKGHKYFDSNDKTRYSDGNDRIKISKHGKSDKKQMSYHKEHKYNEANKQSGETKYPGTHGNVLINDDEESGEKILDSEENKYSNILDQGHRSRWWIAAVDMDKASNQSGEWVTKLAHGRAEQRRRDHESDWVFDRAESRNSNRKISKKHLAHHRDRVYNSLLTKLARGRAEQRRRDHESDWVFDRAELRNLNRKKSKKHLVHHGDRVYNCGVCNKTSTFKDETSKKWKVMKQCMK